MLEFGKIGFVNIDCNHNANHIKQGDMCKHIEISCYCIVILVKIKGWFAFQINK